MPAYNAYELASMAHAPSPDSRVSPGAEFLLSVQAAVDVALTDRKDEDRGDLAHEIADDAVPVYTHELWSTFVDLAAYNEDPSDLGYDASDMTRCAQVCLYLIADRLAVALFDESDDDTDED